MSQEISSASPALRPAFRAQYCDLLGEDSLFLDAHMLWIFFHTPEGSFGDHPAECLINFPETLSLIRA
jgi:hypothetical protein